MAKPIYLASALDDFASILRYITQEGGNLAIGQQFVGRLRAKCLHLAELPGTLGTDRAELATGLRSISSNGYVIFFRYRSETIEIVNVLHGSRDIVRYFGDN